MEKLQKSSDPVYIDGLMSEVLAQTEFGTVQLVKEYTIDVATTIWEHMPSLQDMPSSLSEINFNALPRSRPILINFLVMIISFVLCRRYGINYLIFLLFVLMYCLYEYLDYECHRVSVCSVVDCWFVWNFLFIFFVMTFSCLFPANRIKRSGRLYLWQREKSMPKPGKDELVRLAVGQRQPIRLPWIPRVSLFFHVINISICLSQPWFMCLLSLFYHFFISIWYLIQKI